ncbi:hypothetical protein MTP99_009286 [Tenebrio molitor]|nr:hypothetical protein MTP99_009286 [Tenebrio molitor]
MPYSNEEYLDMVLLYGECNQNATAAAEEYAARFPNRRRPNPHVILRLISRARHKGSLNLRGCWGTTYSKSPCNGRSSTGGCRTRP